MKKKFNRFLRRQFRYAPDVREKSFPFQFGLSDFEGGSLAFAVLGEADLDRVALEVDVSPDDVVLGERGAEILKFGVGS